ncbi:MAG: DUF4160 domain-containing protein [Bacteroidota bacterium]
MPTILRKDGFRFFFFSNDHAPPHIHVSGKGGRAKFDLLPVSLVSSNGLKSKDLKAAHEIVADNQYLFLDAWNDFFK